MQIFFVYQCTAPVPGADGFGIICPAGQLIECSAEVGAALIAAGVARDSSDWVAPPPELVVDLGDATPFPVALP